MNCNKTDCIHYKVCEEWKSLCNENYINDSYGNCENYNPTEEEIENPFITECRNAAIEKNLPLYFVYYEETGIFEVYITETKELFEKRHCAIQLSAYMFQVIANRYLDAYSDWKAVRINENT